MGRRSRSCNAYNGHAMRLNEFANRPTENPILELKESQDSARFPSGSEPSITHPFNTSVIKIRDNGCIDVFSGTNIGIRLDPNHRNISVVTDGERHHIGYLREWIQKDVERYVGRDTLTKIGGNMYLEVKGNVTAKIGGNLDAQIGGNVDIENGGTVTWTSGGNMYFNAPEYYFK